MENKRESRLRLNNITQLQMILNSMEQTFKVISKPEPPDAIIAINGSTTWIEITDAFFSRELAESITTHVADDKSHKPVPKEKRVCIGCRYF